MQSNKHKITIIGAGIGGLSAAAVLARSGLDVTVLEAHVYPGGCASTFYHRGYQFDAGATLAGGFYHGGPMDLLANNAGISNWQGVPTEHAMRVYLPENQVVDRYGDSRRWDVYRTKFGERSFDFWLWQEKTADSLWDLALRLPPWPSQDTTQWFDLIDKGIKWAWNDIQNNRVNPYIIRDAFTTLATRLNGSSKAMKLFVDAQLIISAQTTSQFANALYSASALDLPRRGVLHLRGGIGSIANTLAESIQQHGGLIRYRQEVVDIQKTDHDNFILRTKQGDLFESHIIIFNLPPWNINRLLGKNSDTKMNKMSRSPIDGWGAFMLYMGVDDTVIPIDMPLHNQVVTRTPLGEGNSVFFSINPKWDDERAPQGHRAITVSTHTKTDTWWHLYHNDRSAYEFRKSEYQNRMLSAIEIAIPAIREAVGLILPGTPVTFERFTRRYAGWVGGFPQTSMFRGLSPQIDKNTWMVGDSIFPGQSIAAVSLGGMRVAQNILEDLGIRMSSIVTTDQTGNKSIALSNSLSSSN